MIRIDIQLLILGPGGSGKSTIFKQLQTLHGGGFVESDILFLRPLIYSQITREMRLAIKHYIQSPLADTLSNRINMGNMVNNNNINGHNEHNGLHVIDDNAVSPVPVSPSDGVNVTHSGDEETTVVEEDAIPRNPRLPSVEPNGVDANIFTAGSFTAHNVLVNRQQSSNCNSSNTGITPNLSPSTAINGSNDRLMGSMNTSNSSIQYNPQQSKQLIPSQESPESPSPYSVHSSEANEEKLADAIRVVMEHEKVALFPDEVADAVQYLYYNHPKLQHIFEQRRKPNGVKRFKVLTETTEYFWKSIDRIRQPDYMPTQQDIIYVRHRTCG